MPLQIRFIEINRIIYTWHDMDASNNDVLPHCVPYPIHYDVGHYSTPLVHCNIKICSLKSVMLQNWNTPNKQIEQGSSQKIVAFGPWDLTLSQIWVPSYCNGIDSLSKEGSLDPLDS